MGDAPGVSPVSDAQGGSITAYDSIRRLVEHVLALPDEGLAALGVQDAALCQVWWANGGAGNDPPHGIETLENRIQRWLAHTERPERKSEGRRSQTLLRELIDRLEAGELDKMNRDELDLLEAVHGLSQAAQNPGIFERVRRTIAPRRARIAARRSSLRPVIGTPTLTARFLVARASDILAAPAREIKIIAGVEMPSRGPVMVHSGHVRVLGDVPQGATLVVEDGACVIDGYVIGRVAVSGNCEVLNNISGVVISRNGDVRSKHIIDGALVVAKRGWVYCRRAAGAKLIFAGNSIRVAEHCSRSKLISPYMNIGGTLESGEVHISRRIDSVVFRSTSDAPLSLVFRRSLSCKDYGEDPGKAMATEVAKALRCRAELDRTKQQMQLALGEAESAAETVLTHLLAGDAAGKIASEVLTAQRRLDVINRVLIGLRALYAAGETKVDTADGDEFGSEDGFDGDFFDQLDSEIDQMVSDHPDDAALGASYDEVTQTRQHMKNAGGNRKLMRSALSDVSEKLARWRDEFIRLEKEVKEGRERIRQSVQSAELFQDLGGSRSRVLTLQRLVQRFAGKDVVQKRLEAPFASLLMRTIEKRLALSRKFKDEAGRLQKEFDGLRDKVWTKFQMQIETGDPNDQRIVIEGRFETHARLFSDPGYVTAPAHEIPKDGQRLALSSGDRRARYVCSDGRIAQEMIDEPAEPVLAEA